MSKQKTNSEKAGVPRTHMLDSLKGIAILCVIITHLGWEQADRLRLGFSFWVEMAVPVFMLITGYLHAASYYRAGGITRAALKKQIPRTMIKYTVPFAMVYVLELLFFSVFTVVTTKTFTAANAWEFFLKLFQGGWGPGSFYYPVLVQLVFLFPCIFCVVEKYRAKGLVLCGGANILFEIVKLAWGVSEDTYRMLVFRYIFVLAFGCWLYMERERSISKVVLVLGALIGGAYIAAIDYFGYMPTVFNYWSITCMISAMLAVPPVYVCLKGKLRCRPLEKLGEASYAIFLVQMVWFGCGGRKFVSVISDSFLVEAVSCVAACVIAGLAFHVICGKCTKYVLKKFDKENESLT